MKTINTVKICISLALILTITACSQEIGKKVKQKEIARITQMPDKPAPYKMIDWEQKALKYDEYIFDFSVKGQNKPFIWLDSSQRNIPQTTFGLYTVIGDQRNGSNKNNGEFHEALNSLGAILGATLVGIDKSNQNGYNYVEMAKNYFNIDNGWNIIMNNTSPDIALLGGGYGRDYWYDVFPNVLFYAIGDLYDGKYGYDSIMLTVANQFYKSANILNDDYRYAFFNFKEMRGIRPGENGALQTAQEDAAAGYAYILYSAYKRYGEEKYLKAAIKTIEALIKNKENRFYEVLMPFGAYIAARLNASHQKNYDISKLINWTFEPAQGRKGWGVISERWGDYDVHGLQGSITDNGGFAFAMNSFDIAFPLVPMVRYAPQYAKTIGKWMLNLANNSRLFYADEIPDKHQVMPGAVNYHKNLIAYEGIRKEERRYGEEFLDIIPMATGDGRLWVEGQPKESVFSLYGSGHVGILGSIVKTTNVEGILQLNCLATDLFRDEAYPTYLYYNPYESSKEVEIDLGNKSVKLYNILSKNFILENQTAEITFSIPPKDAMLLTIIPENAKITYTDNTMKADGLIVDYTIVSEENK